jgi:glycerol-3-phosphate acyltransferase PlsY
VTLGETLVRLLLILLSKASSQNPDNAMAFYFGVLFIVRPLAASICALIIIFLGLFTKSSAKNFQKEKFTITAIKVAALTMTVLALTASSSILLSKFESGIDPLAVWSLFFR